MGRIADRHLLEVFRGRDVMLIVVKYRFFRAPFLFRSCRFTHSSFIVRISRCLPPVICRLDEKGDESKQKM